MKEKTVYLIRAAVYFVAAFVYAYISSSNFKNSPATVSYILHIVLTSAFFVIAARYVIMAKKCEKKQQSTDTEHI